MKGYSDWMTQLLTALGRLPGIGRRSAERILFYLLKANKGEVQELASLLNLVKEKTVFCERCHNFADQKICYICSDTGRDQGVICVVEDPKDVIAIEKTGSFAGVYHVLLGSLSALEGIGPNQIQIRDLIDRINQGSVREVVIATNPNTEGETTALYLSKLLKGKKLKVTRLAHGISVGSMLEYTDQATLSRAFDGRVAI